MQLERLNRDLDGTRIVPCRASGHAQRETWARRPGYPLQAAPALGALVMLLWTSVADADLKPRQQFVFPSGIRGLVARNEGVLRRVPVIAVSGAWHGADCWSRAAEKLADAGHTTYAFDFPRQTRPATLARYRSALTEVVAAVRRHERQQPVVLAHSMGGAVLQLTPVHQIAGAVLLASVPPMGASRTFLEMLTRYPVDALRTMVNGQAILHDRARLAQLLVGHADPSELPRLNPESPLALWRLLLPFRRGLNGTPTLVVVPDADRVIPPRQQQRMAYRLGAESITLPGAPHDVMWTDPGAVAGAVSTWAERLDQRASGRWR